MSQRNRGRGSNRNNGSDVGEEVDLWKLSQSGLHNAVELFNEHSDNAQKIHDLDKIVASNKKAHNQGFQDSRNQLEGAIRTGVKICERDKVSNTSSQLKDLIENLTVLKGIQEAKEKMDHHPPSRPKRDPRDFYDFDLAGDGPVPSPLGAGSSRSKLGSSREDKGRDRDSVPPRDRGTPARVDSMEPVPTSSGSGASGSTTTATGAGTGPGSGLLGPGSGGSGTGLGSGAGSAAATTSRTKITFSKDEEVAFRPKPINSEHTDWILGIVQQVSGEGKSRRYKVLDPEPDDVTGKPREYRTSASSMIPIPPASNTSVLPRWEKDKTVLALYPGTTTFYKAEVQMSDAEGKVHLRFEGEENTMTMQMVDRRYVVEYRG